MLTDPPVGIIPGFLGWWCLDDASGTAALDSSGNGCDGTLENMSGSEWTHGLIGGELAFNGEDQYISVPNSDSLQPTTALTITGWINANAWSSGTDVDPILRKGGTSPVNYQLAVVDQRVCLMLDGYDGTASIGVTCGNTLLKTNRWYFVAGTWDGSAVRIYVNGKLDNDPSDWYTGPLGTDTRDLYIGGRSGTDCLNGILDDVRFYSRALTAQQISDLASGVSQVIYEDFEEARSDGNAQSLTIPTPGPTGAETPVSILGSWTTGLTHTAPFGSKRLLILTAHATDSVNDPKLEAVTYGGQAMTKVKDKRTKEENAYGIDERAYVIVYMLDETGIDNATNSTFVPTWQNMPSSVAYSSVFLEDVDQSVLISDKEGTDDQENDTVSANAVATGSKDMVIVAGTAGNTGYYSMNHGVIEMRELSMSSADGVVGYLVADGNDVIPSITHNDPHHQVVIIVVRVNTPFPLTEIEGDLLIAVVATDSSETISASAGENWTQLSHGTGDGQVTVGVWAKLAGNPETGSHTFTWTSDEKAYGWIMRFTGHDPSNPLDVMASQGGKKTKLAPSPSVTTTVSNTMILRIGGFDGTKITLDNTGLSGHATITMDEFDDVSGGAGYIHQSQIGPSGSVNFELTGDEEYRTITIAIAPAP